MTVADYEERFMVRRQLMRKQAFIFVAKHHTTFFWTLRIEMFTCQLLAFSFHSPWPLEWLMTTLKALVMEFFADFCIQF